MTTLTSTDQPLHARTAAATAATTAAARAAPSIKAGPATLVVMGDAAAVLAAVLVSGAPLWALALVPATLTALSARGQYRPRCRSALDSLASVVICATFAAGLLMLAAAALAPTALPAAPLGHAWLLACGLLVAGRGAALAGRGGEPGTPTVIMGTGEQAAELLRVLSAPADGLRPVAHLDLDLADPRLDDPRALASRARDAGGREVVIVPGDASDASVGRLARACAEIGLGVAVRPAVGESGGALAVEQAGPVALVRLQAVDGTDWRLGVKHGADRLAAAFMLFCMAPVLAAIALAVRVSSPGAVLYRQRRVGRDGREFAMLKFRSMRAADPAEDSQAAFAAGVAPGGVEGTDRRTAIGTLLRRTSLDELPQLLNVARGEMSLVGPRPERPEFVDRFSADIDRYAERHRLKSGMTGLAQVNGLRGKTSIRDRVAYDNHYVEHFSLWLDVKVLLATVRAVFQPAE
jgi:exopolysaccharide biosynthesis polyprenyl glycosylphosphotransferase